MVGPSCLVLVKNDAYYLPYVLSQTRGVFERTVIYDVGSTDNTRDIIDWFQQTDPEPDKLIVKKFQHLPPNVQLEFRNSQIVVGDRPIYFLLDGDELYKPEDMKKIPAAAEQLYERYMNAITQPTLTQRLLKRYGVFNRIELTPDLTGRYNEERTHHRLYTWDSGWKGTHPGEEPIHRQKEHNEISFSDIKCWHFHNTERSPQESAALGRLARKMKKTYNPEGGTSPVDLLAELPILQKPIENFPVSPALARLQKAKR